MPITDFTRFMMLVAAAGLLHFFWCIWKVWVAKRQESILYMLFGTCTGLSVSGYLLYHALYSTRVTDGMLTPALLAGLLAGLVSLLIPDPKQRAGQPPDKKPDGQ